MRAFATRVSYDDIEIGSECGKCGSTDGLELVKTSEIGRETLCRECRKIDIYAKYRVNCSVCGERFVNLMDDDTDVCLKCAYKNREFDLQKCLYEKFLAAKERERKTKAEKWRVNAQNARARSVGLIGDLTLDQWIYTVDRFDWKCAYCNEEFEVMEHITPLSSGGGTTFGNVVPACNVCNHDKVGKPTT